MHPTKVSLFQLGTHETIISINKNLNQQRTKQVIVRTNKKYKNYLVLVREPENERQFSFRSIVLRCQNVETTIQPKQQQKNNILLRGEGENIY